MIQRSPPPERCLRLAFTATLSVAPGQADLSTARLVMLGGTAILVLPLTVGLLAGAVGIETAFGIGLPLLVAALALTSAAPGARR